METLKIRNWDRWQSYRKDRGQPPWIKIHREVMRNVEWVSLTDAQRGQLVAIWLLAADHNGVIPASSKVIMKLCHMDTEPDIKLLTELGFIEYDANLTPTCRQRDVTETDAEAEAETDISLPSEAHPTEAVGKAERCPYSEIVNLYHEILPNHPRVKEVNEKRKRDMKARWNNGMEKSLEVFRDYFTAVLKLRFLTGRVDPPPGRKRFMADFDFLMRESTYIKILEGKYHD